MTAKEALQVLIDYLEYPCDKEYDIVWNALNRLEELEKENKHLKNQIKVYKRNHEQELIYIAELRKVLKIIKQKGVNTNLMFDKDCEDVETYNEIIKSHIYMRYLTETEFNLLKEYLK